MSYEYYNYSTCKHKKDDTEKSLYMEILSQVKKRILSGEIKSGEKLESIRKIASERNVSNLTVLKAYKMLLDEKLVVSQKGKGYYISNYAKEQIQKHNTDLLNNNLKKAVQSAKLANMKFDDVRNMVNLLW